MIALAVVAVATLLVLLWLFVPPWLRARQHRRLAARPLPRGQRRQLKNAVPLVRKLTPEQQRQLQGQVQIFLADKKFYGCAGQQITDRVRLTIAGQACLLCLQPDAPCYPGLRSVLVYPSAFYVRHDGPDETGLVSDQPDLLAGEAWDAGRIILSWEDAQAAVAGAAHNVVVHEFAHQLDFDNPQAVGAPALADYADWSRVFSAEFENLRRHGSPVLDIYGATNAAEFFAVATEAYIQRGADLAAEHAELYRLLQGYYGLNTAA